ncbi:ABC transporter permease [Paenibacillus humicola]|uniref:ABC transporter permease n=1 Tax=Paenibacillus humicola TaxID=3110540 RepID=UPI00237C0FB0|nr:ABC transporter permease [Paenibacillus humicola]
MTLRVLSAELLKIRRKMIWFLIFLGPLGVVGLQAVNFGLRYDYLMKIYKADPWGGVFSNVFSLMVPTLFMGLAIITSMTAGIEHQTNAWKMTLALPVTRTQVFTGKFLLNALLLLCSSTLLAAGTAAFGAALGLNMSSLPYVQLLEKAFYPFLAIVPFIALQVWLSVTIQNQAVPLTFGIAGTVFSLFASRFGDAMPYYWPYLVGTADHPLYPVAAGIALGAVLLLAGAVHFARKDVK